MKNILLIGLGRFGRHVAIQLNNLGHEVMAVDNNEERVNDVCMVTIGGNFQNSLETTSLLKELGAKTVVSRAERDVQKKFLLRNGADEVVYPEKQIAEWAAIRYTADHIRDYIQVDEAHAIFEVEVPENWISKTIGQLDIRKKFGINIVAIREDDKINMAISPNTIFQSGTTLLVLGEYKELQKCFRM